GNAILTINDVTITSTQALPLWQWASVSASVGDGQMSLFINGQRVANASYTGSINPPNVPIYIGYNNEKVLSAENVREGEGNNLSFFYGIQGLLDEVRIFDTNLSDGQISANFAALLPSDVTSSLGRGVLPGHAGTAGQFGAEYKTTEFSELWESLFRLDDYADIVVKFDNSPGSVVYWHGTNYAANWINENNHWMSDQSSEIFGRTGLAEHMSDKQLRYAHVRLIENSPARVVVHWRYASADIAYEFLTDQDWTDEYHTIYPDGVGIREVNWNAAEIPPGFNDIQFLTNPGESALDVLSLNATTLADLSGATEELVWQSPDIVPSVGLSSASIRLHNTNSIFKNFSIYSGPGVYVWGADEQSQYTTDPFAGPW
ncbi:MAG: LamG-like jellyroll fold domain-containing protein, partial [Calditrichota bacterium]